MAERNTDSWLLAGPVHFTKIRPDPSPDSSAENQRGRSAQAGTFHAHACLYVHVIVQMHRPDASLPSHARPISLIIQVGMTGVHCHAYVNFEEYCKLLCGLDQLCTLLCVS